MSEGVVQTESLTYKIRGLKDKEPFDIDGTGLETVGDLMTQIIAVRDLDHSLKLIHSGKVLAPETKLSEINYKPGGFFVYIEDKKKPETKEEPKPEPKEEPIPEPTPAQEPSALNDANRDGIYANIFVTLIKMSENTDKMAEHLNDINLLKTMMKDQKIAHTLMALSPELRKKMVESNPQIKQIIDQYPNEYKEVIEDPELLQKGQVAFNKTMQYFQQQMGMMPPDAEEDIYENTGSGSNDDSALGASLGLNDEDMKAVNEITNITGKLKHEVMQVYVACDKNKELTINMLFN